MLYLNYPPKGVRVIIIMLTLQLRLREIKEPAQSKQVEKQRLLVWLHHLPFSGGQSRGQHSSLFFGACQIPESSAQLTVRGPSPFCG